MLSSYVNIFRKLAALARRLLRRRPPPRVVGLREPPRNPVGLYAGDDNQVYLGLLSGGIVRTLAQTSAGPCWGFEE